MGYGSGEEIKAHSYLNLEGEMKIPNCLQVLLPGLLEGKVFMLPKYYGVLTLSSLSFF